MSINSPLARERTSSVVAASRDSEEARAVISHKVGGGGGVLKENKDGNYGRALSLPPSRN